jgi:hypothetical protein
VLKTTRPPEAMVRGWAPGTAHSLTRCVRRSYRLELVTAGQPCLLWLSGPTLPGVHALGTIEGPVSTDDDGPLIPVRMVLLAAPVPRGVLLADPRMRSAEVLRMPAGSNPSWLSAEQFGAVLERADSRGLGRWRP